jgi:hypothetical protein
MLLGQAPLSVNEAININEILFYVLIGLNSHFTRERRFPLAIGSLL